LLFYLVIHFIIPIIYYHFYDFVNLYSDIDYGEFVYKGIILNIISIIGTICVIQFLPDKKIPKKPIFNHSFKFYILCVVFFSIYLYSSGGYDGLLEGSLSGALISYILLFFDPAVGLILFLFLQKKIKYEGLAILIYVLLFTIGGSRSAIIIVVIIYLILQMFENSKKTKNKLRVYVLFFCLISPLAFYFGTSVRGVVDDSTISKLIVGRISMVELAGIPIEAIEKQRISLALYESKYGIVNQIKQSINEISPIDPFKHDTNPNQYYRAIFLDKTELSILDKYMSMNITLPIYFYLETNMFFGCLFTIFFLSLLYYVWVIKSENLYFLIGIIMSLYYLLQYFDWVMVTAGLFRIVLTIWSLNLLEKIINILSNKKVDKMVNI
jgi:hypothetical protein